MPRILLALSLVALVSPGVTAQEPEAPAHDELGFPITFNEDIITKSDVLRGLPSAETLGSPSEVRKQRDRVLMEHITEMVGRLYGIAIDDREVKDELDRQMGRAGGEAKFYEFLGQTGQTLEGFREGIRLQILQAHLSYMLTHGYTPGRKLLPWNPVPTPREIEVACRTDPARRNPQARLRLLEMVLDLDTKSRTQLAGKQALGGKSKEWLLEQISLQLAATLEKVEGALEAGEPFAQVAETHGVAVVGENPRWVEVPKGEPRDEIDGWLQSASGGDRSPAFGRAVGGYRIFLVLEEERPGDLLANDPKVIAAYRQKIQDLRRRKAEALLRLKALDQSTLRPERVREEFRGTLLAGFREAEEGLRAMGVH